MIVILLVDTFNMLRIEKYVYAPNLYCVIDDKSGTVMYVNIYKSACEWYIRNHS